MKREKSWRALEYMEVNSSYKYLGVLRMYMTLNDKMKLRKSACKKFCRFKLNGRNLVSGINAWAVGVVKYNVGIAE